MKNQQLKKKILSIDKLQLKLSENEVQIWNFDLNNYLNLIDKFANILSIDELNRAGKFYFGRDKNWFIVSRGLLRVLVSVYTGIPAKEINFVFNNFGKPLLSPENNNTDLHFNLSHSKNYMSAGFVIGAQIGIDVELVKPLKDHLEIAKRFFSASEVEQLISFPADKILDGFYSCWTAKEAVIKLSGEGLSFPLKEFDVKLVDLNVEESYRYRVNLKKQPNELFIDVYKLNQTLYGACAISNERCDFIHYYFDDEDAISSLIM